MLFMPFVNNGEIFLGVLFSRRRVKIQIELSFCSGDRRRILKQEMASNWKVLQLSNARSANSFQLKISAFISLRMVIPEKNGKVIKRISNPVPTILKSLLFKCFISLILWKIVPFLVPHPFCLVKHDMNAIFHNFFQLSSREKAKRGKSKQIIRLYLQFHSLNRLPLRFYCLRIFPAFSRKSRNMFDES